MKTFFPYFRAMLVTIIFVCGTYSSVLSTTPANFFLSFDANGGTGQMNPIEFESYKLVKIPDCTFTREGYEFSGWLFGPGDTSYIIKSGDALTFSDNTTLYAYWMKKPQTAVNEISGSSITVFPNPAKSKIRIKGITDPTSIQIIDLTGRILLRQVTSENLPVDIAHLAPGIYFLRVDGRTIEWIKTPN